MEDKYMVYIVLSIPLLIALFILCSGRNPISIRLKMRNLLFEVNSKKEGIDKKIDSPETK
ncbi:hypothetical protein [Fonticella tunisiensis]|uniref:Uncharacterized protein n=1 Tax=Fonticella tunisiensis TaxID=1096341 RepID=A0A4R7KB60_9CLOT|nr:hypothetical protein [Fonticella tunisiensis]TDT51359.1 hypothetical protein EDD71_11843 [Fonticella tunisiensis]